MMRALVAVAALATASTTRSQNLLYHYDGTTEFTSRGVTGTDAKSVLQCMPVEQICGVTSLLGFSALLQDQNAATPETYTFEVRGSAVGGPDMTASGLICSAALTLSGGSGTLAFKVTTTLSAPCPLPPCGPGAAFYLGFAFPANASWSSDGISCHTSVRQGVLAGEQMCAAATTGYPPAPVGDAGLGWEYNVTTSGGPVLAAGNRAWRIAGRYREDTLQPFADNAAVFTAIGGTGANPNYGYAGIWPDAVRGDRLGLNLQTGAAVGSPTFVFGGVQTFCPLLPLPPAWLTPNSVRGLCVEPLFVLTALTVPVGPCMRATGLGGGNETATSQASWGPLPLPFITCNNGSIHWQAVTLVGASLQVSTSCTTYL